MSVERTVGGAYSSFSWVESVDIFVDVDGLPTLEDTGTRATGRDGKPAVGSVVKTARRGETVALPKADAERGDALGAFTESGVAKQAAPDAPAAEPVKRKPGRPRKTTNQS